MFLTEPLKVLENTTVRKIHSEALDLLESKGIKLESEELRTRLAEAGARVSQSDKVIRLPKALVEKALAATPKQFVIDDLKGNALTMAIGQAHLSTYTEALNILDHGADRYRPSRLEDLIRCLKLTEQMPEVVLTAGICVPSELQEPDSYLETIRAVLTHTRKAYCVAPHHRRMIRSWAEAVEIVRPKGATDKHPALMAYVSTTSPFVLDADSADVLLYCAEAGIPIICDPCPMAGGTSPFTIAGTLLLQVAENMFLLTAKHILNPKLPAIIGGAPAGMDMRTAQAAYGGIERRLMNLAALDVFRTWGLPTFSPSNSVDSCLLDAQIGAEKTWTYLAAHLSDPCMGTGIGAVSNGQTVSLEQMVIDRQIIGCVRRFVAGVDVSESALAKDVLSSIPHGGNFLTESHTLTALRQGREYFYPELFNRQGPTGQSLAERAHAQVRQMLDSYQCPVPQKCREHLDNYIDQRKKELR